MCCLSELSFRSIWWPNRDNGSSAAVMQFEEAAAAAAAATATTTAGRRLRRCRRRGRLGGISRRSDRQWGAGDGQFAITIVAQQWRFEMFDVRFPLALAAHAAAPRAAGASQEEVLPLRQVQLHDARQGALYQTRQIPFDADDQVRPVRVPHAVQVEPGPSFEESHGRRHVQVFALQFHSPHQAESNGPYSKSPSQSRESPLISQKE